MARIEAVRLIDDLTGDQAEETVELALDGVDYQIDLTSQNATTLREALAPYIGAGRRSAAVGQRRRRRPSSASSDSSASLSPERRQHNNAVRAWARQHGYSIGVRGRIPIHVVAAYEREAGRSGDAPSLRATPPRSTNSAAVQFQTAD